MIYNPLNLGIDSLEKNKKNRSSLDDVEKANMLQVKISWKAARLLA